MHEFSRRCIVFSVLSFYILWIFLRVTVCVVCGCDSQDVAPRISLPNSSEKTAARQEESASAQPKSNAGSKSQGKQSASSGWWIGGIWSKLALRPKNQMKLPDDKNPSVSVIKSSCSVIAVYIYTYIKIFRSKFINNKHLFIFALSLFTRHCNPLVDTILH